MSAIERFVEELRQTAAAGEAAIITGNTTDIYATEEFPIPVRLCQLVAVAHVQGGLSAVRYSVGSGATLFTAPGTPPASIPLPGRDIAAGDAVPDILEATLVSPDRMLIIIDHASAIVPPLGFGHPPTLEQSVILEALQHTALEPSFSANGNVLVLIARGEINRTLVESGGFRTIRMPLPDAEDLERTFGLVGARAVQVPERYAALEDDATVQDAADEARGLRNDDIVIVSRQAAAAGRPMTRTDLNRRKSITIEREARGTLRQLDTGVSLDDVAALAHVKRFLSERVRSGVWPPSILLAGPPGVGKTFVVRAIAAELRRHLLEFHAIRSKWLGESEANQTTAFAVIEDLAPNVVLIDEVDQQLGQRSTGESADGGTSERLLASMWSFTGDGTGRPGVLFCMTSNRPDLLDAANLDRVEVIPILHPTPADIVELLPAIAAQSARTFAPDVRLVDIASNDKLRLTSARHLGRILGRAATLADLEAGRGSAIAHQQLIAAIDDYSPQTQPDMEELMALRALTLTNFDSLLPWRCGTGSTAGRMPYYVEGLVDGTGRVDKVALQAKVETLRGRIAARKSG